jgi:hypothetical protein
LSTLTAIVERHIACLDEATSVSHAHLIYISRRTTTMP